jgi:hypothetical protein
MQCKGKNRLARVLFRDHIIEFPLPVAFIRKARDRGLKIRHPVNGKVTTAQYVTTVIYWHKKTFVYVFATDD